MLMLGPLNISMSASRLHNYDPIYDKKPIIT